jgi:UDP-N-acetylmuramoyl-tripeptide--D-alanyl-D-alanine ligase
MKTQLTKGNHEFSTNDLAPAAGGGSGRRGARAARPNPIAKRARPAGWRRYGYSVGIAERGEIDAVRCYASFGRVPRPGQFVTDGMDGRSLQFLVNGCGGVRLSGPPEAIARRVCTDSRHILPGDVFFALRGERFDGHAFIAEVAKKGAVAVVIEKGRAPEATPECAIIGVDDTRKALGYLAARYRNDFNLPIIAVGGSNGKTSTKELIASVLRQKLSTLSSEASFNNDIGVPLTLLKLEKGHEAAVLEVGTNHPGELAPLVRMIRPDYGVITTIGREHLEFFNDLSGVAAEEGWLAELLPPPGKLFVNGDNAWTEPIVARANAAVARVGFGEKNDWRASSVRLDAEGMTFRLQAPMAELSGDYRMSMVGRHQAVNALYAIALGAELGLSRAQIERGLAECKPSKMRLQVWDLEGVRVLDDAYNANADSVIAALQTLQEIPCKGRRIAVLGDMGELGRHSEAAHAEVGRRAAELGVGQLFAVGKMAPIMAKAAREAGLNRVFEFADVETAGAAVKSFLKEGDVLLLKASRASRLERISDLLRSGEGARKN